MKKRLQQLIDYLHTNVSQFEKNISVSNGAIRNAMLRDKGLNSDVISKILDIYPTINPDWLLLGRGEMLRQDVLKTQPMDVGNMVSLEKYEKKVEECVLLRTELNFLKEQAAKYAEQKGVCSTITTPAEI